MLIADCLRYIGGVPAGKLKAAADAAEAKAKAAKPKILIDVWVFDPDDPGYIRKQVEAPEEKVEAPKRKAPPRRATPSSPSPPDHPAAPAAPSP